MEDNEKKTTTECLSCVAVIFPWEGEIREGKDALAMRDAKKWGGLRKEKSLSSYEEDLG